jgi:ribosomal protein S18 acetylase RimI-like enzyme
MPSFHYGTPVTNEQWQAYYQFRWQQLRSPFGLALGSERDALEDQAYHRICLTEDNNIIGIGRIHYETINAQQLSARIRYMAVATEFQGLGIGRELVMQLLADARNRGVTGCYLHAREEAYGFYQAIGFELKESIQSELDHPHFLMQIRLG